MNLNDLRVQLEEDLAWRLDELRRLRNELLGSRRPEEWPVAALRSILVMQYAHLEGYARQAFTLYVTAINARKMQSHELKPHLFASACTAEFEALRLPSPDTESEDGKLTRRAKKQVEFVERIRTLHMSAVTIDPEAAISMEMNFGSDVLRRTLFRLGIPESEVSRSYFKSIEFVRNTRNDIAHGNRKERIPPGLFQAHQRTCEQFMQDLARLITTAVAREYFKVPVQRTG
ncbi:MAE_28990/MAE_18760 family HEPN-like nuclease [Micromonospora chersina]